MHNCVFTQCNDKHVILSENLMAGNTLYELHSVIMHKGSLTSGHYTNLTKEQNNWFFISDQSVRIANSITEELSKAGSLAYIMFLNKAQEPSTSLPLPGPNESCNLSRSPDPDDMTKSTSAKENLF